VIADSIAGTEIVFWGGMKDTGCDTLVAIQVFGN
jgi:hypothetical protein